MSEEEIGDLMDIVELQTENQKLQQIIDKAIEILEKYNDNENNYYVPVNIVLEILDKENK